MIKLSQCFGGEIVLRTKPKNIISLVPSITENLILFGKTPMARTSFCIEPKDKVKNIPVIGGTKTPRISKVIAMKPDLVIANQEENIKEHIEEIQAAGIPVWVTFPKNISDLIPLMKELGSLCDDETESYLCIDGLEKLLQQKFQWERTIKVITLIWKNPWMAAGQDTYPSHLLSFCGMENPITGRYPKLTDDEIRKHKPDLILLPTEPYEFKQIDAEEWQKSATSVLFCGEDLLWSGPRVFKAVESLTEICKRFQNG